MVQATVENTERDGSVEYYPSSDGVQDRQKDRRGFAYAGFRLERREIW